MGQRHLGLIIPIIKCFIYFIRHLMFSMNLKNTSKPKPISDALTKFMTCVRDLVTDVFS